MLRNVSKKRIVLIEDDDEVRAFYKLIIDSSTKFAVVGEYSNCEDALKGIRKIHPDIVLMDIELPGMNGIEGAKKVKEFNPFIEVVIVSIYEDSEPVYNALKAGAAGYISKNANYAEILTGLDEITKGGAPMSSKIARMIVEDFHVNHDGPLTPKETEVLRFLSEGKSYTRIADELFISKETVKTHLRNIYKKLKVHRKSDAIRKGTTSRII